MGNILAKLTSEQQKKIDQLESEMGVVLVAYNNYTSEDENGAPLNRQS